MPSYVKDREKFYQESKESGYDDIWALGMLLLEMASLKIKTDEY